MATLFDNRIGGTPVAPDPQEQLHNSKISENYRIIKEALDRQFDVIEAENATTTYASTIAPERPNTTQAPAQTPTQREAMPLFTPDTLDRAIQNNVAVRPITPIAPMEIPVAREEKAVEESYSLNSFAKTVAAVFAAVIVMMLTMICINTQVLNQKEVQLAELEQTRNELVTKNVELKKLIKEATSDERIEEFAKNNGMVKDE